MLDRAVAEIKCWVHTRKTVCNIVGPNHIGIKTGKDGANGEQIVPLVERHRAAAVVNDG